MPKLPEVTQVPIEDFHHLIRAFQICGRFLCDNAMIAFANHGKPQDFEARKWIKRGVSGRWVEGWVPDGDVLAALDGRSL